FDIERVRLEVFILPFNVELNLLPNLRKFIEKAKYLKYMEIVRSENYNVVKQKDCEKEIIDLCHALERFSVMYVKWNIGKALKTDDKLKLQILTIQSEKECFWMNIFSFECFLAPDPAKHELFQNTSQNNEEEFNKLFTCYEIGKNRIYKIYRQDIEKSEMKTTIGRRAYNALLRNKKKTCQTRKREKNEQAIKSYQTIKAIQL
ncbi:29983_t:CDS:2, partial [Gigaspora margarita]